MNRQQAKQARKKKRNELKPIKSYMPNPAIKNREELEKAIKVFGSNDLKKFSTRSLRKIANKMIDAVVELEEKNYE
jgi:hypothetical protein